MRYLGCTQEACECEVEDILGLYKGPLRGAMWVVWVVTISRVSCGIYEWPIKDIALTALKA